MLCIQLDPNESVSLFDPAGNDLGRICLLERKRSAVLIGLDLPSYVKVVRTKLLDDDMPVAG